MSMSLPMDDVFANPRDHPDNAHLPLTNRPETILGTTITFLSIALIAVVLRLWGRLRDRLWGWDDFFVLLAAIASCLGDIVVCLMPRGGLGLHFWTLSLDSKMSFFKHIWASNGAYCASAGFIKLAILFQYLRLFAESTTSVNTPQYRNARRATIALIIFSASWGVTFTMLALFPCRPVSKYWNFLQPGTCVAWGAKDPDVFFWLWALHSASNMSLDLAVYLLPIPFLSMLRLEGKSRFGIISLFAVGGIVVAVSIGRMVSLVVNKAGSAPIIDTSYHIPTVYIFSVLEVNIAILCASIPIFWPIITSFASNKILVVNEISVHVEEYPKTSLDGEPGIGLAEQGAWRYDDGKYSPPTSPEPPTRKPSLLAKKFSPRGRGPTSNHQSKPSASKYSFDASRQRPSQDSLHNLYRTGSAGNASSGGGSSVLKGDYSWFAELDREGSGNKATTKVERVPVPYDHIKALS